MPTYVEIPELYVPPVARVAARQALAEHVARLALPWGLPALVWFDDLAMIDDIARYRVRISTPGRALRTHPWDIRVWGWANVASSPATLAVYVNVRQPIDDLPRTVAHECRHHWQFQTGRFVSEDDAHRYAGDGPYRDAGAPYGPYLRPTYAA